MYNVYGPMYDLNFESNQLINCETNNVFYERRMYSVRCIV